MFDVVTVLPLTAVFELYVASPDTVKMSPAIRLSEYVTEAVAVPSYTLLVGVTVTFSVLWLIVAVVVIEVAYV